MRFNVHTHIFNFKSLFTEQSLKTLANRLSNEKWPTFVVNAVVTLLKKLLKGEYLDEEALLEEFVGALSVSKEFKSYLKKLNGKLPADVGIVVDGDVEHLAVGALRQILKKLGDLIDENDDAENQTLDDLVAFLVEGIRPTIAEVADRLMRLSGEDAAVVALMMDITEGGSADEGVFVRQLEDTWGAALAYPGRILPFVAVNTLRKSHYERMENAVMQKGFLGVKLYPSLGYEIANPTSEVIDPKMERVLEFCENNDVPLLMHCNKGGFFYEKTSIQFADPNAWRPVLKRWPKLRICFGHFGGDENLTEATIPAGSWTATIVDLMRQYPNVYADIAYHTDPMSGGEPEKNYFRNLAKIIEDPTTGPRVLFGSDFFLVRMRVREDNLWRYFEARFTKKQFKLITDSNPAAFLGLSGGGNDGRNISRHLDWLYEHRNEVGSKPADWVVTALEASHGPVEFTINELGWRWSPNNEAHFRVWRYFANNQMYPAQQTLEFLKAGGLLVRQMRYWNKEHESADIFQRKCKAVAEHMNVFMLNGNAKYETGYVRKNVEPALAKLLSNGDTRLADIALAIDRMFSFRSEGEP